MLEPTLERPWPHSIDAERLILGAVMVDNRLRDESSQLTPDDFWQPANRRIFTAILELEGVELNAITIGHHLGDIGELEAVGGMAYLSNLTYGVPPYLKLKTYIAILRERSLKRRLIRLGNELACRAMEDDEEAPALLGWLEQTVAEQRARQSIVGAGFRRFADVSGEAVEHYERLMRGDSNAVATGYATLDKATRGGIHPGELWVVAALTGRGKSAWAIGAARQMAQAGNPVAIVSREMSDLENFVRAHSAVANVPAWHISAGMWPQDHQALLETMDLVAGLPIWIDSKTSSVHEIKANVRRLKREGVTTLFCDYLQLLNIRSDTPYSTRAQEVAACSRVLKEIAMDCEIGVVALAQFNRLAAHEEKPEIHHLAESGNIEKDADLVLILDMEEQKEGQRVRKCNMRIAKHRNGPQLTLRYEYNGDVLTFSEAA